MNGAYFAHGHTGTMPGDGSTGGSEGSGGDENGSTNPSPLSVQPPVREETTNHSTGRQPLGENTNHTNGRRDNVAGISGVLNGSGNSGVRTRHARGGNK